jgi:hypothetical protein
MNHYSYPPNDPETENRFKLILDACSNGDLTTLKSLPFPFSEAGSKGFGLRESMLQNATIGGHTNVVQFLLFDRIPPFEPECISAYTIRAAIENNSFDIADLCIAKDPEVIHISDDASGDALFMAVTYLSIPWVSYFLAHGGDPNADRVSGLTMLAYAVSLGNSIPIIEMLLKHGANIAQSSCLQVGSYYGRLEEIKFLLDHGAELNESLQPDALECPSGVFPLETPLHLAMTGRQPDVVKLLLDLGANINLKNQQGETALMVAQVPEVLEDTLRYRRDRVDMSIEQGKWKERETNRVTIVSMLKNFKRPVLEAQSELSQIQTHLDHLDTQK